MNKNLNEKIGFGVFVECLYVKKTRHIKANDARMHGLWKACFVPEEGISSLKKTGNTHNTFAIRRGEEKCDLDRIFFFIKI